MSKSVIEVETMAEGCWKECNDFEVETVEFIGDMRTYMKIFRCANVKRCNTIKKILLGFAPEREDNGNG